MISFSIPRGSVDSGYWVLGSGYRVLGSGFWVPDFITLSALRSPLTSHVSRRTSHVSCLTSHLSPLTSHVSPLTSHVSHLTSHLSPLILINMTKTFFSTILFTLIILFLPEELASQSPVFTRQDTLRGSITPERAWWDLVYYHLDIVVNPDDSTIFGTNTVAYNVITPSKLMQIDLQEPLVLTSAVQNGKSLSFKREGNVYWIELSEEQGTGKLFSVILSYGGKPQVSRRPPWSGGITWTKDSNNLPFIASACQGDGASLWWPCKDHMYDEPDSMLISVTVPDNLMDVSNGRLRSVMKNDNKTTTYNWFVGNPINNYGVNINIGDYVHFSEIYKGEKGSLDCDYYVLRDQSGKGPDTVQAGSWDACRL